MLNSNVYDYVKVLDKAADAAWLRNEAIANNIANVDTPGYKRIDVNFEDVLDREMRDARYISVDEKVVDIDTENTQLAANQLKYNALIQSLNQEFARIQMVLK